MSRGGGGLKVVWMTGGGGVDEKIAEKRAGGPRGTAPLLLRRAGYSAAV